MNPHALCALLLLVAACDAPPTTEFRTHQECPEGCVCVCEDPPGGSSSGSIPDVGGGSTSAATTGATGPSYDCPAIVEGLNTFGGDGLPDRTVLIERYGTGGPLSVHWYGTNGSIATVLPWGSAAATRAMVAAEGGVFVVPEADPAAIARPNGNIFPWWIVGDHDLPEEETDRQDDFLLMDAVVTCLAGEYDPARITTGGASAGAIMSSYLLAERTDLAGAAIWSGGTAFGEPMTPASTSAAAMVLHGGVTDQYCGPGSPTCYEFLGPSESLAEDLVAGGSFAFLCDHGEGDLTPIGAHHTDAMANEGAEFMRLANTAGHPWESYPFGPSLPNGALWMLDNYCYSVGDPSPW